MQANLGLSTLDRSGVVELLNTLLADEFVLYTKTRNYHWHVVGPHFSELHTFFETQYNALSETVDAVAERVRALDGQALGSLAEYLEHTRLSETPGQYPRSQVMLSNLLADHETIIRQLRIDLGTCMDTYHDAGTSDFLTGLMEQHEKMAWMLRAYVAEPAA